MLRIWLVSRGGFSASSFMPAVAVDQARDRIGKDRRGIGEQAAPIAGMMPALAQIHVEMDADAAAAAEEDGRPVRRQPRPVGGEQQIGLQLVAQATRRPC